MATSAPFLQIATLLCCVTIGDALTCPGNDVVVISPTLCIHIRNNHVPNKMGRDAAETNCKSNDEGSAKWHLPKLNSSDYIKIKAAVILATNRPVSFAWLDVKRDDPVNEIEAENLTAWAQSSKWRWTDGSTLEDTFGSEPPPWKHNEPNNWAYIDTPNRSNMERCVIADMSLQQVWIDVPCVLTWNDDWMKFENIVILCELSNWSSITAETPTALSTAPTSSTTSLSASISTSSAKASSPIEIPTTTAESTVWWPWLLLGLAAGSVIIAVSVFGGIFWYVRQRRRRRTTTETGTAITQTSGRSRSKGGRNVRTGARYSTRSTRSDTFRANHSDKKLRAPRLLSDDKPMPRSDSARSLRSHRYQMLTPLPPGRVATPKSTKSVKSTMLSKKSAKR